MAENMTGETIEQLCQRVMEKRGYLVITSSLEYPIGKVIPSILSDRRRGELNSKTVVIAKTNVQDFMEQGQIAGFVGSPDLRDYFYRVIAE